MKIKIGKEIGWDTTSSHLPSSYIIPNTESHHIFIILDMTQQK